MSHSLCATTRPQLICSPGDLYSLCGMCLTTVAVQSCMCASICHQLLSLLYTNAWYKRGFSEHSRRPCHGCHRFCRPVLINGYLADVLTLTQTALQIQSQICYTTPEAIAAQSRYGLFLLPAQHVLYPTCVAQTGSAHCTVPRMLYLTGAHLFACSCQFTTSCHTQCNDSRGCLQKMPAVLAS